MNVSLISKLYRLPPINHIELYRYSLAPLSVYIKSAPKNIISSYYSTIPPIIKHVDSTSILRSTNSISKDTIRTLPQLFKLKLSALVLCTTLTGFVIIPGISIYDLSTIKLLFHTLLGTALSSFSANSFNQWIEASFDAQMKRTKSRPIPSRIISLPYAFILSSFVGIAGVSYLYYFVSGISSLIAASTIMLYAGIYTPMKRYSIANTWIGSIVGALPPLIGWTAGLQCVSNPITCPFGWISIFGLLYFWQFPHFFSLSWALRRDYARAGYQMCSLVNPELAVNSSLRNTLALFPLIFLFYFTGISNFNFVLCGTLINCILLLPAIDFKIKQDNSSARRLFLSSLIHLPLILAALFLFKS